MQVRILLSELMISKNVVLKIQGVPSGFHNDINWSKPVDLLPVWSELNQCYYIVAEQKWKHREIAVHHVPKFWIFVGTHDAVAESG